MYLQNLLKPPIGEYAQALRDVGYPEWIIKRMYRRHKEVDEPVKTVQESFDSKEFKKSKSKKGTYFPDLGLQYSTVPYSTVRVPSRVGWSRPYSISVFGSILILLLLKALAYWPLDKLEGIDGLLL